MQQYCWRSELTYHPYSPLKSHDACLSDLSCDIILVPGGASGVEAKSNSPKRYAQADNLELDRLPRKSLKLTWFVLVVDPIMSQENWDQQKQDRL